MIFSNIFRKFFNPFASFCMLASYARAQGRTRVYLLIHALNRFTKSYKIISDCSDWGIDTLF